MYYIKLKRITIPFNIKRPLKLSVNCADENKALGEVDLLDGFADCRRIQGFYISEGQATKHGFSCLIQVSFQVDGKTKLVGRIKIHPLKVGQTEVELTDCRIQKSKAVYTVERSAAKQSVLDSSICSSVRTSRLQSLERKKSVQHQRPAKSSSRGKFNLSKPILDEFTHRNQNTQGYQGLNASNLGEFMEQKPKRGEHHSKNNVRVAESLQVQQLRHQLQMCRTRLSVLQLKQKEMVEQINSYKRGQAKAGWEIQRQLAEKQQLLRTVQKQLKLSRQKTEDRQQRVNELVGQLKEEIARLKAQNKSLRQSQSAQSRETAWSQLKAQLQAKARQCAQQEQLIRQLQQQNQRLRREGVQSSVLSQFDD